MEVSLLQHAKDKSPQAVTLDKVVELIRGDQWPPGYEPLMVVSAVVEGGLQKKNVRWLTGLSIARLGYRNEKLGMRNEKLKLQGDPHTLLCWTDQSGGMYVVYAYELNDGYGKDKQMRYYGKVQHFGMEYYAQLTGCEADRTLVGVTKTVALCHDAAVYYNAEAMPFLSADVTDMAKSSAGLRDSMSKSEMNSLKADITTAFFNYRKPYDRYTENHKHIASFCATGNHIKFLNDPTGTRRWLPFRVESILSPYDFPFDHDGIFAQAYALYREGYAYYFSEVEIEWLNERNKGFTVPNLEQQLVYRYFRKPVGDEPREHVDAAMALQIISGSIASKLYPEQVDAAFAALGFEEATIDGMPGYLAIRRKPEEVNALGRLMVLDATKQKKT